MEGKKYVTPTVAFSMTRAEIIERSLRFYKEKIVNELRDSSDDELSTFAADLARIDGIISAIEKARNRASANKS